MILITGAAGHLGNVLTRELVARGEKVRALILPGEDSRSLQGLDIEKMDGDIMDLSSLEKAFQGIDTVYHLAAIVSISPGNEKILWDVNVEGTKNVLKAIQLSGVKQLVYTSSIHAITRPPHGIVIDENLPFEAQNPAGEYDSTKAAASIEVINAARQGLNAVIVCPTGVIGPHDYRRSEMGEMILSWMSSRVSFLIEGFFDFVDVRDVAIGHILAAQKGRPGQVYILSGERIALVTMWRTVKDLVGTYATMIKIPFPLAMIAARISEVYYHLSNSRPRFTRYALETVTSNCTISYQKASHELGYQPRSLIVTLQDTVAWWLENRKSIKPSLRG